MQVSATSTRSILDSVSTRIDEAREITRYIVNMLIFLGLLGTFYGLATTVPAVVDTIRSLDGSAVARDQLRAVQTPQGFDPGALRAAHAGEGEATDDASLVEANGGGVVLVDGDVRNLKITRPVDLELARALLHHR